MRASTEADEKWRKAILMFQTLELPLCAFFLQKIYVLPLQVTDYALQL